MFYGGLHNNGEKEWIFLKISGNGLLKILKVVFQLKKKTPTDSKLLNAGKLLDWIGKIIITGQVR